LARLSTHPEAIYTHDWKPNDIVIWDNRATLHRAGTFDYQSLNLRRLLHRVVIAGDPSAYPSGEPKVHVT
jgi:alpha-ketoglutarate-dependent taurine dioxygenase